MKRKRGNGDRVDPPVKRLGPRLPPRGTVRPEQLEQLSIWLKQLSISRNPGGQLWMTDTGAQFDHGNNLLLREAAAQLSKFYPTAEFPQFCLLPKELRLKIWRETWEYRNVEVLRTISEVTQTRTDDNGSVVTTSSMFRGAFNAQQLRLVHANLTKRNWSRAKDISDDDMLIYRTVNIVTNTTLGGTLPISLWVDKESRGETRKHFDSNVLGLPIPGAQALGYFNFNLDTLVFPFHSPLSVAFSRLHLGKITSVEIPELAPCVTSFSARIGPYDDSFVFVNHLVPGVCHYEEFQSVWLLLRIFYPCLREIYVTVCMKLELLVYKS